MKKLITVLFLALTVASAAAQEEQNIFDSRDIDSDRLENIGGSYGLLLLSKHNRLKVNITNVHEEDYETYSPKEANADGLYEYRVIIDPHSTNEPKVEVHRIGDLHRVTFVTDPLKPDFFVAYRIEEVAVPIHMQNDTRGNDAYLKENMAALEFRTKIKGLKINTALALGATSTDSIDKKDESIKIINVVFPVSGLVQARKAVVDTQAEYDRLTALIDSGKATDADLDNHDRVEKQLPEVQKTLNEMSSVIIYSDNTNNLSMDISDMGPKQKRCILVLPLETEKKVFTKEFQGYLDNGMDCLDKREYADARTFYVNALNSNDCDLDIKPAIKQNIDMCDSCILYSKLAGISISKFIKLRDSGNATQQQAAKYAESAIEFLNILNNYNPDDFYTSRMKKLSDVLNNMPLNISFTVMEWRTTQEGAAIPDVEVWAWYGDEKQPAIFSHSMKGFGKAMEKSPDKFKQAGVSDAQGNLVVELDRNALPTGFVFCPTKKKNTKLAYIGMSQLMRKAKGTYLQKQFRMKLYTRTNKYF